MRTAPTGGHLRTRTGTHMPSAGWRTIEVAGSRLPVRDLGGPTGAPVVILVHGWTATADTNFAKCYRPLSRDVRVIAFDQRGHGRGIRSRWPFRLSDCADDIVAVADALGIERFVPVGYSMGGAIAQLTWKRHPDRVRGLVLCATATRFASGTESMVRVAGLGGLAAVARLTPPSAHRRASERLYLGRKQGYWEPWAIEAASAHDWRTVLEAGAALGSFRSDAWIGGVDVPTAVVIPTADRVVPPHRQEQLAAAIPGAVAFRTAGNHLAAATSPRTFVSTLRAAVATALERPE